MVDRRLVAAEWVPPAEFEEYRLLRRLGRGAMGTVYLAHDRLLDRLVAIKFIASAEADKRARERVIVEARAIARVQHENVVTIHRVGQLEQVPYLVSEFVRGTTLEKLPRPLSGEEAQSIGADLARGLSAAHQRGVLHRDLKPANVILADSGHVKLLDFGLAKLLDNGTVPLLSTATAAPELDSTLPRPDRAPSVQRNAAVLTENNAYDASQQEPTALTQTGGLFGTPLYMAPEVFDGEPATCRSDLYSLGALLYELCAGRPPHQESSVDALRQSVLTRPAAPLRQYCTHIEPRFAAIIDRCLRRAPEERFSSAKEVCTALESLFSSSDLAAGGGAAKRRLLTMRGAHLEPQPAIPPLPEVAPAPAAHTETPTNGQARPRRPRQLWWSFAAGLFALSITALLLFGAPQFLRRLLSSEDLAAARAHTPDGMALIPTQTFRMGSTQEEIHAAFEACRREAKDCKEEEFAREQPAHAVTVHSFYLDKIEVSNRKYADWLNLAWLQLRLKDGRDVYSPDQVLLIDLHPAHSGIEYQDGKYAAKKGYEDLPVVQVTWHGARQYCRTLGRDLPTEGQWELAARASGLRPGARPTIWPWGAEQPHCGGVVLARDRGRECQRLRPGPEPVGTASQDVTADDVHDLGGNVHEWVLDQFLTPYPNCRACQDPVTLPSAAEAQDVVYRVLRGGTWHLELNSARSASRSRFPEKKAAIGIGFRCAAAVLR